MEKEITNSQMRILLARMQEFQRTSEYEVEISTHFDEDRRLWFVSCAKVGKTYKWSECYPFHTYYENRLRLEQFINELNSVDNYETKQDSIPCQG